MGKTKDIREAVEAELGFDPPRRRRRYRRPEHKRDVALTVRYGAQRTAAELAIAALTRVRNIRDYIEIGYDADPADVDILVQDALNRWALIPDDGDVKGGYQREHGDADLSRPYMGRA